MLHANKSRAMTSRTTGQPGGPSINPRLNMAHRPAARYTTHGARAMELSRVDDFDILMIFRLPLNRTSFNDRRRLKARNILQQW